MCVKIIRSEGRVEFDPSNPLETQIHGAERVLVNYDPSDPVIDSFVTQMEQMAQNGTSCSFDVVVEPNNYMNGFKLRTKLKKIKYKIDINEAIKKLVCLHSETDKKILEIAERCLTEKLNER